MIRVGVNALFLGSTKRSGTATYTWSVLRHVCAEADIEVVVFTQGGEVPDDPFVAQRCAVVSCPTFSAIVGRVAWEQTRLPQLARAHRIDVLWSPGYVSPLLGGTPKVVTVHDVYYDRAPEVLSRMRRIYYRTFVPASVGRSEAVIAVSESTRADLEALVPKSVGKTTVVHEAARPDLVDVVPAPPAIDAAYVLMVASVTANKNVGVVIDAVRTLRDSGHDLEMVVVGSDPFGLLASAVQAGEADAFVRLVSDVSDAELAGWYRSARVLVQASTYEGFGLPVLEAQLLGVPVISSDAGPLPEVAGDGAEYFDPHDVDALCGLISSLADDATRQQLAERGTENVQRFDWERAGAETAAVFRSVARGGTS